MVRRRAKTLRCCSTPPHPCSHAPCRYDAHGVQPAFPFGHGLSYTQFGYSDLAIGAVPRGRQARGAAVRHRVSFALANSGKLPGAEVAQLYLGVPADGQPPKALKGFAKVALAPGESRKVELDLTARDLSVWNDDAHQWREVSGTFEVFVGASSRDIRLQSSLANRGPTVEEEEPRVDAALGNLPGRQVGHRGCCESVTV